MYNIINERVTCTRVAIGRRWELNIMITGYSNIPILLFLVCEVRVTTYIRQKNSAPAYG